MINKVYSESEIEQAKIEEAKEREALQKMQEESIRKFKEMFPNGATIIEAEFLE